MERPILFNAEMVQAILEGRKTSTRRIIKPQPVCYGPNITFKPHSDDFFLSAEKGCLCCRVCGNDPQYSREGTTIAHYWEPPYQEGDTLWVQETWKVDSINDGINNMAIDFKAIQEGYHAAEKLCNFKPDRYKKFRKFYQKNGWQSPYFMPKEAARIFLKITDVRVQRLQDITDEEAEKEGCNDATSTAMGFPFVWDSTVNKKDLNKYGWDANPWVWVIEFERK